MRCIAAKEKGSVTMANVLGAALDFIKHGN